MQEYAGYKGKALRFLQDNGIAVGDAVRILGETEHLGRIMPRYEHSDGAHVSLKLDSGYNVGVGIDGIREVTRIREAAGGGDARPARGTATAIAERSAERTAGGAGLPKILLISTGGTIASRIDYRTGAVTPVLGAEELVSYVPELAGIAEIDTEVLFSEHSENITPDHWLRIAESIGGHAKSGYAGIMVAHGTDTMHYTSSFLSFALAGFPIPIALVGAQRSSDRASSDAPHNLVGAARLLTRAGARGVYVVMHEGSDDDKIACHAGTRVRKNHTSRRGAFETVGGEPAFVVSGDRVRRNMKGDFFGVKGFEPRIGLDAGVALVKYHPGYDPALLDHIVNSGRYRAIVFEGTGLGHTGRGTHEGIRRARQKGMFLGMTSQCIDGAVAMTVYESGRDLLDLGVVPLRDMVPETALIKAMWAAGNSGNGEEMERLMLENVASEMSTGGGDYSGGGEGGGTA